MAVNIGVNIQRSPNRINQALRDAGVNGQYPKLFFDFVDNYYLTNGSSKSINDAFTFTRNGNATMVDSDGYIKWAPHNLFDYSIDLTNASWNASNTTITANAGISPDGENNAFEISHTSSTASYSNGASMVSGAEYTIAIYVKYVDHRWFRIYNNFSSGSSWYDLQNGIVGAKGSGADSHSITDIGNGWYLVEQKLTAVATAVKDVVFLLADADGSSTETSGTSALIFAPHVYRSDLGGMVDNPVRGDSYVPTTSSAVYMPRVGHHKYNGDAWVDKGGLFESEARANVVDYSNYFNNSATYWVYSALSVTHEATTSPDGATSGAFMIEGASANIHSMYQIGNLPIGTGTGSFYVKPNGRDYCQIRVTGIGTGQSYVNFDLQNGVLGTSGGTQLLSKSIEPAGNGWYRISMTVNGTNTFGFELCLVTSASAIERQSYTGDGTSGIYVYGAQFEQASTPSSYIPTNGSSVTRAAESITVPYANLPWPTPTYIGDELVTNGDASNGTTGWAQFAGSTLEVLDGRFKFTNTAGGVQYAIQYVPVVSGKVYAVSVEIEEDTTSSALLRVTNQGANLSITGTSTKTTYTEYFVATSTGNISVYVRADSVGIAYFDNISVREINPLSVSIAMQGEVNYSDTAINQEAVFVRHYESSGNYIIYELNDISSATGKVGFFQVANGITDAVTSSDTAYSYGINVPFNIAGRHGSTFVNGSVDGTAFTANTTPVALPDLSATNMSLAFNFNGTISSFRIWDRDIGDIGIAEATKPSTEPSLSLTFDGQPSSFTNGGLTV